MEINTNSKALELLIELANSLHDREINPNNFLFFSANEVKITEDWINDFVKEIRRDCVRI